MKRLTRAFADAEQTMRDMVRQGRMSHAEVVVITRAITDRYVPDVGTDLQEHCERQAGGPTQVAEAHP